MANERKLSLSRAIDEERKFCQRTAATWAQAMRESWTHTRILEAHKRDVYDHPMWQRLPRWACARVEGVYRGCADFCYMTNIVKWQLFLRGMPIESKDVNGEWPHVTGAHVWAHSGIPFNPPTSVMSPPKEDPKP